MSGRVANCSKCRGNRCTGCLCLCLCRSEKLRCSSQDGFVGFLCWRPENESSPWREFVAAQTQVGRDWAFPNSRLHSSFFRLWGVSCTEFSRFFGISAVDFFALGVCEFGCLHFLSTCHIQKVTMRAIFSASAIALLIATPLYAQPQGLGNQSNRVAQRAGAQRVGTHRAGGPGTSGSNGLAGVGLAVGQRLPDITIHDARGKPFRMADLKGQYSVLVFGCLT